MGPTGSVINRRQMLSGVAAGAVSLPAHAAAGAVGAFLEAAQYGLVGDGTTLNDSPLAAALAAMASRGGGVLRLGVGTFLFSKALTLPAGTVLEGGGMGVTILKCTADVTGVTFPSGH